MKVILKNFECTIPGKWILSGEHTVIRGGEALVFPLPSQNLSLKYKNSSQDLEISAEGENSAEIEFIVWSVIERALKKLNLKRRDMHGEMHFVSKIRFGAGVGASATLCAAITTWFVHQGYLQEKESFDFARDLENIFHGESSGVDVAVALQKTALLFSREKGFSVLSTSVRPKLYLSFTGTRGVTKDCVERVKDLAAKNPGLARSIDEKMTSATQQFKNLLLQPKINIIDWIQAMNSAQSCFENWGLVNESTEQHKKDLISKGALAVKLTGSGLGGYMLSLWNDVPTSLTNNLIPCFTEE